MPFTISHAVLAPLIHRATRKQLPISALAIGCMLPDLYRLFTNDQALYSHLWSSMLYPNMVLGLVFCLLWYSIVRPTFFRFFAIHNPLPIHNIFSTLRFLIIICIALCIGMSTHIIWDGLTHVDYRTLAFRDFLSQQINIAGFNFPMHRALQVGSSAVVLPVVGWMAWGYFRTYHAQDSVSLGVKLYGIGLLLLSLIAGVYGFIQFAGPYHFVPWHDLYRYVGTAINYFFRWFLLCILLGCLIFQILEQLSVFDD